MMEKIKNSRLFLKLFPKLDRLEVYMLAADNPVGRRQLRPIFRRKRNREVLTREQVTAIKRGRRVLRQEMKLQGIKRREDFEAVATNLGLFFDRGLLWAILFWFLNGSTAVKILATTAVLTTVMTVTQPVIEYVTEYVTQYITQYVTQYVTQYLDKDRFTIHVSEEMLKVGFELSETPGFENPREVLYSVPSWDVPCISIMEIPSDVDMTDGSHHDTYFAYTFYCRYINKDAEQDTAENLAQYAMDYDWGIKIHSEGLNTTTKETQPGETLPEGTVPGETTPEEEGGVKVSDAVWVMVIQDGEVIVCAKADVDAEGNVIPSMLPTPEILETKRIAYIDRSIDYINIGLAKIDPRLNVDNVSKLDTLFATEGEITDCQEKINAYFEAEGISDLTRLMLKTENWRDHYNIVGARENYNYYQVVAETFVSDEVIVERTRTGMLPWIEGVNEEYHKYTVVIWLEGDDPQCTNDLMNGFIGLNFQIKGEEEEYTDAVVTPTVPSEPAEAG